YINRGCIAWCFGMISCRNCRCSSMLRWPEPSATGSDSTAPEPFSHPISRALFELLQANGAGLLALPEGGMELLAFDEFLPYLHVFQQQHPELVFPPALFKAARSQFLYTLARNEYRLEKVRQLARDCEALTTPVLFVKGAAELVRGQADTS